MAATTLEALRLALIARGEAAGLTASSAYDVEQAPNTHRAGGHFSVHILSTRDSDRMSSSAKATGSGAWLEARGEIKTVHRLGPKSGQAGDSTAMTNAVALVRYLMVPATTLTADFEFKVPSQTFSTLGKGEYHLTRTTWQASFLLDLAVP